MKEREALKQLLEALDKELPHNMKHIAAGHRFNARTLLAQPEREPVALETVYETIIQWDEGGGKRSRRELARRIAALYTTPPQRTWVGLTDEEVLGLFGKFTGMTGKGWIDLYRMTEAKLKEKNT